MKILQRYILKEHFAPFILSLFVVTFLLLIDRIIDLLNIIIEKKLDFTTVMQVFGLSLPFMLALSIPMAVLVATILAFGRMAVDREIIAVKSSGVNIYLMTGPLLFVALSMTIGMMYFNHYFLPDTNHKLKNLMMKIAYYKPMTVIKPNEFNSLMDYTIYVKENNQSELKDIIIYDKSETRFPKTLLAKSGNVIQMDNGNAMRIILKQGEMHERNEREAGKYQVRLFQTYVINIRDLGSRVDYFETGYRSDREMTASQLKQNIRDKQKEIIEKKRLINEYDKRLQVMKFSFPSNDIQRETRRIKAMRKMESDRINELNETIRSYKVEYHKKFSLSFAILIFVLIGIPLGLMTRSSGIGMAFSVSSVIFLIYYIALNGGEQFADKGYISPFLAMWLSNFIFFVLAVWLIIASIYEKKLFDLHILAWRLSHLRTKRTAIPDEIIH